MSDELNEFKVPKEIRDQLKDKDWLKQKFSEGKTGQEILGFSPEAMGKFYRAAYRLFQNKKYAEAANAFLFLITLNPNNHDYWLGLGMSTQLCGDYEAAIDAYEMAAYTNLESPVPYFYLAKCLFAIHDRESALYALDMAIEYASDLDEFRELKEQAVKAKELLVKEI